MDTFITSVEEIGRKEGRAQGRKEGRQEVVILQLTRKVGTLTPEVKEQIDHLSAKQRLKLIDALLDFQTMADLTTWLAHVKK
jgi:predicted transposase YdaD